MNEASVSAPFMKLLRLALPGALVIKHRDASIIGLPDCSVTWHKRIAWLEFKLWVPPKKWDGVIPHHAITGASPTQLQLMTRFSDQANLTAYIIWVKKSKMIRIWVLGEGFRMVETTPQAVEVIKWYLENR